MFSIGVLYSEAINNVGDTETIGTQFNTVLKRRTLKKFLTDEDLELYTAL